MKDAKWKRKTNLKPKVLLEKIKGCASISEDNRVTFKGWLYQDAIAALYSMISFPNGSFSKAKDSILLRSVTNCIKNNELTPDSLMQELNVQLALDSAIKPEKFHLLTSISVDYESTLKVTEIEGAKIRAIKGSFPKKYTGRSISLNLSPSKNFYNPAGYTKVIVTVQAKSIKSAATEALRILDILRAVYCIFANPISEVIGSDWKPINRVRLERVDLLSIKSRQQKELV